MVTAFLDGEVVVATERGTPDFSSLQADLSEGRSDRFQYYAFDLLHLDGLDLTGAALLDRKAALADLLAGRDDGILKVSEHFAERGDVVLAHACRMGLEGIVSKLARAPYRSGRSKSWLKAKCVEGSEFVIIGYVPSTTQRRAVGSLVLATKGAGKGKLAYAGRVGSGYLECGGRGAVAAARGDPGRWPAARQAAAPGGEAQRALDETGAGGRR